MSTIASIKARKYHCPYKYVWYIYYPTHTETYWGGLSNKQIDSIIKK